MKLRFGTIGAMLLLAMCLLFAGCGASEDAAQDQTADDQAAQDLVAAFDIATAED